MWKNKLYYGDNLEVLRRHFQGETVDLVYLDPPFKSGKSYNILFEEKNGSASRAQIKAFEDTWYWDRTAEEAYREIIQSPNYSPALKDMLKGFRDFLRESEIMAYLVMMAIRLVELHRVLKPTGSIYLHCDPTASHYLKLVMDAVFGPKMFLNELVWKRSQTRSSISRIYRRAHDVVLFYAKSNNYLYNIQYRELSEASKKLYCKTDQRGVYRLVPLLVSGRRGGKTGKPWRGIDPNIRGKGGMHWVTTPNKLEKYEKQGLIVWPSKSGGAPNLKYYLKDNLGVPVNDFWDDVPIIPSSSAESLGYPTQKPEAVLERIVKASSNEGDIVLDPFCGCGTTVVVAEKLNRRWIGIDITHLAITLMKHRLIDAFGPELSDYKIIGEPVALKGAEVLAKEDPFQFQFWALGLVGARPSSAEEKRGPDRGIDGKLYFMDEKDKTKTILIQVKSGHVTSRDIRDLRGTMERQESPIGVFITLRKPTREMTKEAVTAGYYESPWNTRLYPRIQIFTIDNLLKGKKIQCPGRLRMTKEAKRVSKNKPLQMELEDL